MGHALLYSISVVGPYNGLCTPRARDGGNMRGSRNVKAPPTGAPVGARDVSLPLLDLESDEWTGLLIQTRIH